MLLLYDKDDSRLMLETFYLLNAKHIYILQVPDYMCFEMWEIIS